MQIKRIPFPLIVVLVAAVIAAGYYAYTNLTPRSTEVLTASGTVEAAEVSIAPELSGKVTEVRVKEGDRVKTGDVLFRLDDSLLQSQRKVAAAGLETSQAAARTAETTTTVAQSQYDLTLIAALAEQKANRTSDWAAAQPAEFKQQAWYFDKSEQLASVQNEVTAAQSALEMALKKLASVEEKAASGNFTTAEKRLMSARTTFEVAQIVQTTSTTADQNLKDSAQKAYDNALIELNSAQKAYSEEATTSGASDVLTARADLRVAQERFDTAQDIVRALQTGSLSPKVAAAQKALEQALAAAAQSKTAVAQAEASLALVDTQILKLTVLSPVDGIVLTRSIEPGPTY
jgi:HlyD family secretion protein